MRPKVHHALQTITQTINAIADECGVSYDAAYQAYFELLENSGVADQLRKEKSCESRTQI